MAKGVAAEMLMQKMAPKEAGKPKFGSPEWKAMYGKKKKKGEPDSEEMTLPTKAA